LNLEELQENRDHILREAPWVGKDYLEGVSKPSGKHSGFIHYLDIHAPTGRNADGSPLYGSLSVPYETVQRCYGAHSHISALSLLKSCSEDAEPFEILNYDKNNRISRCIVRQLSDERSSLINGELRHRYNMRQNNDDCYHNETFEQWSAYAERKMIEKNTERVKNARVRHDHPTREVWKELHSQPVIDFHLRTTKEVMPYLWDMWEDMPEISDKESKSRSLRIENYRKKFFSDKKKFGLSQNYYHEPDFSHENTIKQTCQKALNIYEQV
jgi:hypothetical protein